MAINAQINITEVLHQVIVKEIEKYLSEEWDLALEELNRKKDQMISGIVLSMMKNIDIRMTQENLVITVKEISNKK